MGLSSKTSRLNNSITVMQMISDSTNAWSPKSEGREKRRERRDDTPYMMVLLGIGEDAVPDGMWW